jgi:hypothetical protein
VDYSLRLKNLKNYENTNERINSRVDSKNERINSRMESTNERINSNKVKRCGSHTLPDSEEE